MCSAENAYDLLYKVTGLLGFYLVPESDESFDNLSDMSSEDDKDKEVNVLAITSKGI